MNPKRQVIEQAIIDLEKNREVVRQVYEERNNTPYGPDFYQRAEELDAAMEKAREESVNIAVRLFRDYLDYQGNPVVGNPNEAFYDPNPTPIFSVGDFHRGPGIPRTIPAITGARTKHSSAGRSTLRRIDKFIKQLKDKMKRRKDLQENNLFQLTEAKLKQMILEMMSQSEDYYKKLKSLLTTEEGYLQADSLFEMVKDQLDAKHRMYMLNLLEPLHIGKELHQAIQRTNEAYERYTQAYESFEDPRQASQYQLDQTEQAFQQYEDASMTQRDLRIKLNNRLNSMSQAGLDSEIILAAYDVSRKAINGEYA